MAKNFCPHNNLLAMLEKWLKSLKIIGHFLWLFKHAAHINNSTN